MNFLYADFESRGTVDIKDVGLYNYVYHPQTDPLFLNYAIDNEGVRTWMICEGEPIPGELLEAISTPRIAIVAFNSAFERHFLRKLGYELAIDRFLLDPQVCGRYLSMPDTLEEQGRIMDLPEDMLKMKDGKKYIELFSVPHYNKKTKKHFWFDKSTHPVDWAHFVDYGKRDVIAERELLRREAALGAVPLPPLEQHIWVMDQKINDRGIPVDVQLVKKLYNIADRSKKDALKRQNEITGLENANSRDQLLPWLQERGYPLNTLRKESVGSVLKNPDCQLAPDARKVLEARQEAASISYMKLEAILRRVSPDGYLRGQFVYMGSSRCGRWAGTEVQLHNMARPGTIKNGKEKFDFEKLSVVREARALVHGENYDEIKARYGQPLLVVKNLIRTVFVAPGNEGQ